MPLLLVIEPAEHSLGDDVVLHFSRSAIDRRRFAEEPGAGAIEFGVGEILTLPADALQPRYLYREFRAFVAQFCADLLQRN